MTDKPKNYTNIYNSLHGKEIDIEKLDNDELINLYRALQPYYKELKIKKDKGSGSEEFNNKVEEIKNVMNSARYNMVERGLLKR